MLNVIYGILLTIFVEFILYLVYNIGKRSNTKTTDTITEVEELRIKRMQQGFHNVIKDYDVDVAMGRREQD